MAIAVKTEMAIFSPACPPKEIANQTGEALFQLWAIFISQVPIPDHCSIILHGHLTVPSHHFTITDDHSIVPTKAEIHPSPHQRMHENGFTVELGTASFRHFPIKLKVYS